jgi:hypothetical protein
MKCAEDIYHSYHSYFQSCIIFTLTIVNSIYKNILYNIDIWKQNTLENIRILNHIVNEKFKTLQEETLQLIQITYFC